MSDYNFRGISQSNRGPSVTAYSETRYTVNPNFQFYAGSQYWAVTLPTSPTAEVDLYGGIRPTIDNAFIRPLINLRREEIRAWLRQRSIPWREDESGERLLVSPATRLPARCVRPEEAGGGSGSEHHEN